MMVNAVIEKFQKQNKVVQQDIDKQMQLHETALMQEQDLMSCSFNLCTKITDESTKACYLLDLKSKFEGLWVQEIKMSRVLNKMKPLAMSVSSIWYKQSTNPEVWGPTLAMFN